VTLVILLFFALICVAHTVRYFALNPSFVDEMADKDKKGNFEHSLIG